jgi:hypothetical protein
MIQVIGCTNCGDSHIELNSIYVDITFNKSSWCEHCGENKTQQQTYFFCSEKCFYNYISKIPNIIPEFKHENIK